MEALAEPTAYAVIESHLRANVEAVTRSERPSGCLSAQGAVFCGSDGGRAAQFLAERLRAVPDT
jgi:hypothetical protein